MPRTPDERLRNMMAVTGFDKLEDLEEWLDQPTDPALLKNLSPAYREEEWDPLDEEDLEDLRQNPEKLRDYPKSLLWQNPEQLRDIPGFQEALNGEEDDEEP